MKTISIPKVVVLPITEQVIQRVTDWANEEGVYSLKFYDKNRNLETFQDGDQIAGVDDTDQSYTEEAFEQDYEPDILDNEYDVNLQGRYNDIEENEHVDLMMDATDNVFDDEREIQEYIETAHDIPEYRDHTNLNVDLDNQNKTVEKIVVETMEEHNNDTQESEEERHKDQGQTATFIEPKKTRSGKTYAQVLKEGEQSSRSGKKQKLHQTIR